MFDRQLITASEIEDRGILRVSELFLLANQWRIYTIDGEHYRAAGGASYFGAENWTVLINGVEIDIAAPGFKNLNLLPVAIAQIDSVEFFSMLAAYDGHLTDRGLIHIHTSLPAQKYYGGIRAWYGNETGDPGPHVFTSNTYTNQDRLGPDFFGEAGITVNNIALNFSIKELNHYATDPAIYLRNPQSTNEDLWRQSSTSMLRGRFEIGKTSHQILAGYTSTIESPISELEGVGPVYYDYFASEFQIGEELHHLALQGEIPYNASGAISYKLITGQHRHQPHPNGDGQYAPDWKVTHQFASLAHFWNSGNTAIDVGIRVQSKEAENVWQDTDQFSDVNFHGKIRRTFAGNVTTQLALNQLMDGEDFATKFSGLVSWQTASMKLALALSHFQHLATEPNTWWFWRNRGFALGNDLELMGLESTFVEGGNNSSIDLWGSYKDFGTAGISLKRLEHVIYPDYEFLYNEFSQAFYGPIFFSTLESVWMSEAFTRSRLEIGKTTHALHLSLREYYQPSQTGAWHTDAEPTLYLNYSLNYRMADSFRLGLYIMYKSQSVWRILDHSDEIPENFSEEIPGFWTTDFQARKDLWQQRAFLQLIIRNAFEGRESYHPFGAKFNLQAFLNLGLSLPQMH